MVDLPGAGWSDGSLESGFASPRAAALLSWRSRVERLLEVEVALARSQARVGIISDAEAAGVERACSIDALDLEALARDAATATTPIIPLLRQLTGRADDPSVAAALHLGATSQDIIDTAMMLALRASLDLLDQRLMALADLCAQLAGSHRCAVAVGRTLGQHAVPITLGLAAARWLGAVDRRIVQLRDTRPRILSLQLGGAAGTLAAFGERGPQLVAALAEELDLEAPDLPWHAERDRIVELAGALAGVVSVVTKIAGDVVNRSTSEVAEFVEGAGEGAGSSAMPHKRNPLHATAARAGARLALGEIGVLLSAAGEHEYERAAGAWQAEWVALPGALVRTIGSVERLTDSLSGLEVDEVRARSNLEVGLGLTGSEALSTVLTATLGRPAAQALVGEIARTAVAEGRELAAVAGDDARVTAVVPQHELSHVLDPTTSLLNVDRMIDAALATHRALGKDGGAGP